MTWYDTDYHIEKCNNPDCGFEFTDDSHKHAHTVVSDQYYRDEKGHSLGKCEHCQGPTNTVEKHIFEYWAVDGDVSKHTKSCKVCKLFFPDPEEHTIGPEGTCTLCGYDPNCGGGEPCTPAPVEEEKKEDKKEDKKESSSSSSSSKQTYSAPVTAETIRAAEGVTGSKEFVAKQTTMTTTVNNTIAALNNLATINPAQANVLKNIGISLNAGGCTSFNANTAATLIKNNSIQYNLAFTWKNVSFRLVIPKGANISDLVDPVTGQLYFYKLVQRYGLAGCTLIK